MIQDMEPRDRAPPLIPIISALGVAQIISWGSLYYAIAVLGESMYRDLGISSTSLFGAFTLSLFLSGLAAPTVGKLIDRHGGRPILIGGSATSALALTLYATAVGPFTSSTGRDRCRDRAVDLPV